MEPTSPGQDCTSRPTVKSIRQMHPARPGTRAEEASWALQPRTLRAYQNTLRLASSIASDLVRDLRQAASYNIRTVHIKAALCPSHTPAQQGDRPERCADAKLYGHMDITLARLSCRVRSISSSSVGSGQRVTVIGSYMHDAPFCSTGDTSNQEKAYRPPSLIQSILHTNVGCLQFGRRDGRWPSCAPGPTAQKPRTCHKRWARGQPGWNIDRQGLVWTNGLTERPPHLPPRVSRAKKLRHAISSPDRWVRSVCMRLHSVLLRTHVASPGDVPRGQPPKTLGKEYQTESWESQIPNSRGLE